LPDRPESCVDRFSGRSDPAIDGGALSLDRATNAFLFSGHAEIYRHGSGRRRPGTRGGGRQAAKPLLIKEMAYAEAVLIVMLPGPRSTGPDRRCRLSGRLRLTFWSMSSDNASGMFCGIRSPFLITFFPHVV
jgi:hypothetical protein